MKHLIGLLALASLVQCCKRTETVSSENNVIITDTLTPVIRTDTVAYDSDDPAIWINQDDPGESLILGTDKGGDTGDGAIYVFDLQGREVKSKTVRGIQRPNNVDIAYGLPVGDSSIDVAVFTERNRNMIRVFRLPDMKPVDAGGIPVFERDSLRLPMGVGLFTSNGKVYAIVSRKSGPSGKYLWQYDLVYEQGVVTGRVVRKFGQYSGKHEIEAVAVDNELGYVYYSDEGYGVRKYYAHPDSSGHELAVFGITGFADNHEGISIYKEGDHGYILVSDQQANQFQVFSREGTTQDAHHHPLLGIIKASTIESDGNEITSSSLPGFPKGIFIAMSDDKTFQIYNCTDLFAKFSR